MRTLLHTCCGPCASACVPRLKEMDRAVTMLFANSNIDTREEFDRRFREAEKLAAAEGVKIVAFPYDHEEWLREVAAGFENEPEKGARCARCFRYNLAKAAEFASARGYDEFTTSLTVSPHKDSKTVFAAASSLTANCQPPAFLPVDFKKREGFKLSTQRARELGLYRQSYCGCEFSRRPSTYPGSRASNPWPSTVRWRLHHKAETVSTNLDARGGRHGDVFTADFQTAGRGRLDHRWFSPPGTNLMMSAVLSVAGLPPEQVATFPLVAGLAVGKAVDSLLAGREKGRGDGTGDFRSADSKRPLVKWPNDVLIGGKKISGILCERQGDVIVVGIGVNVNQTAFPPEIAERATSLAILASESGIAPQAEFRAGVQGRGDCVDAVRKAVLAQIDRCYRAWKERGFCVLYPELREMDCLKGRRLSVRQTDDDSAPLAGVSSGILPDGSLDVGGTRVYAGEAHVEKMI